MNLKHNDDCWHKSMSLPILKIKYSPCVDFRHENIVAECPYCGMRNIFNRRTDLKLFRPISFLEVECQSQHCRKRFNINGDLVNPSYEKILLESDKRIDTKEYRSSVHNSVQAIESCIALVFQVELLYRPYYREGGEDDEKLNSLIKKLYKKLKKCAFLAMTNHLLNYLISPPTLENLEDASNFIDSLPDNVKKPKREEIDKISDPKVKLLAEKIYNTKIHELRNKVDHKDAYCPSSEEAKNCVREAQEIASGLKFHFRTFIDDINWYMNEGNSRV